LAIRSSPGVIMVDIQKYMTLLDCPYCHNTSATEIAQEPRVVRCNTCGLCRASPRMSREGQVLYLKKFNDESNLANWPNPLNYSPYSVHEAQGLKMNFPDAFTGGKILDVGAANGVFLAALKHAGATKAIGLDPMEKLVESGKSKGLDIHVARFEPDGVPAAVADGTFDIICFRESIYYLPDLRETFDLLRQLLRPGGGLYITSHVLTSIYYWKNRDYLSRYGLNVSGMPAGKAIPNILIKEGYEIQKADYPPFNVLHTLGLPFAQSFWGRIIGGSLSPIVCGVGKGDRLYVFARRL